MPCGPDILTAIHLLSANCASLFQSRCTRDGSMVVQSMGWTDRKVKPAKQGYEADIRQVCGHEGQSNEVADQGSGHEDQSQDKDGHEVCGDEVYREAPESGAILWLAKAQACPLNVLVAWAGPILSKSHQLTRHDSSVIASL